MNYYRRYVGDYLKDTSRLSMLEHGAYGLLLDYYYAEEKPIPLDLEEVFRMVRAIRPEERRAIEKVLGLYFTAGDDGYRQKRVDKEIHAAQQARANGSKGGRPATEVRTDEVTGLATGSVTKEGGGSGHPPTTNHQPPAPNLQPGTTLRVAAEGILKFLNEKAGRNYQTRQANLEFIVARLREGATTEDCRAVIAKKCREWKSDEKMSLYLRPATLFNRTKFAQYQGELVAG